MVQELETQKQPDITQSDITQSDITQLDITQPDISHLVTEDDTPVDNLACEKQQRLLTSALYTSLEGVFLAAANVGIYHTITKPAIVPDVFLSFDVKVPDNWWEKSNRCYLVWQFGKPPEVAIEIVSNKVGKELDKKLEIYQWMRVSYYVVYDPSKQLSDNVLRIFEIKGRHYFETNQTWLEQVGLGLTLWQGTFEQKQDVWLRWCDANNNILPTGDERAAEAQIRALNAEQKAIDAEQRATEAERRAQLLEEKLRAMGIDPNIS